MGKILLFSQEMEAKCEDSVPGHLLAKGELRLESGPIDSCTGQWGFYPAGERRTRGILIAAKSRLCHWAMGVVFDLSQVGKLLRMAKL